MTTGTIRWYGYLLDCRECGAKDRSTLSNEQAGDAELSWLACQNGHHVRHPLIYPEIVHRVISWATSPDPDQYGSPVKQQLHDWLPHWISPDTGAPVYREWTEPGPVDWERDWPELIEAHKILDKVREWSESHPYPDLDSSWVNAWGTADPDIRHIEILESSYRYADDRPGQIPAG